MGLDMYLERMPRSEATPRQVRAIEEFFNWQAEKEKGCKYSFKEWCGFSEEDLPSSEVIEFYRPYYQTRYYLFDEEKRYPHNSIVEEAGYWRKANQIHNWFVQRVQDGLDDCNYHDEVTEDVLLELLWDCKAVLRGIEKTQGGKIIVPESVKMLLPTQGGFFFGSTDYDEYYVEIIEETIEMIEKILKETDFETQMIYYCSSW